jgi:hypothetical protein
LLPTEVLCLWYQLLFHAVTTCSMNIKVRE